MVPSEVPCDEMYVMDEGEEETEVGSGPRVRLICRVWHQIQEISTRNGETSATLWR